MQVRRDVSIVGEIILMGGIIGRGELHGVDSPELTGILSASKGVIDSFR